MPAIQALWVSGASVVAFCFHTKRPSEAGHMCFTPMNYSAEWRRITKSALQELDPANAHSPNSDLCKRAILHAVPEYLLNCFCEREREKFAWQWGPLEGLKPAHLHLIQKHGWTLPGVRGMTIQDLCLALHHELAQLQLPEAARNAIQNDLDHHRVNAASLGFQSPGAAS